MFQSTNMQISSNFGDETDILLGGEQEVSFLLSNISETEKMYNVSIDITLSNGFSLSSASPSITSSDSSTYTYSITNLKDFAPLEQDIPISFSLESLTTYANGTTVPFGKTIGVNVSVSWDSLPRGSEDLENEEFFNTFTFRLTTISLELLLNLPSSFIKGAGTDDTEATHFFTYSITVRNNFLETSSFYLKSLLPNGFRYLGEYVLYYDGSAFISDPTISELDENNQQALSWDLITLSAGDFLNIEFTCAIYERFAENQVYNSGELIASGSNLTSYLYAEYENFATEYSFSMTVYDFILSMTASSSTIDIGSEFTMNFSILWNGYVAFSNAYANFLLADGLTPIAFEGAVIGEKNVYGQTPIEYNIGDITAGSETYTNSMSLSVDDSYTDDSSIYSGDIFLCYGEIYATNVDTQIEESSTTSHSLSIVLPQIYQEIISKQYRDGTEKTISSLAPYDLLTYRLTYDNTGIQALQKNITLDNFFPLETELPTDEEIIYLTSAPSDVYTISPHGIRFELGDTEANTIWQVDVTISISDTATTGDKNNLFKLNGENTIAETYSLRTEEAFYIGEPNLSILRQIDNINVNAVRAGDVVQCTLTLTNEPTDTTTDAFYFNMVASIGGGITLDPDVITISGTGETKTIELTDSAITIEVLSLYVGESVVLYYEATIPDDITPDFTAVIASQLQVPYTQLFSVLDDNAKYNISALKSNYTISAQALSFSYLSDQNQYTIGDTVIYTFIVTVPQGTSIYNYSLEEILPSTQSFVSASINQVEVSPTITDTTISFPTIEELDATSAPMSVSYQVIATINEGEEDKETYQTATGIFSYDTEEGETLTETFYNEILVENPHLVLTLSSATDHIYPAKATALTLDMSNQGNTHITDVFVHLPLPEHTTYVSSSVSKGSISYADGIVTYDLGEKILTENETISATISVKSDAETYVRDSFVFTAQSEAYKNDTSETKEYDPVSSNSLTLYAMPNVYLSISPAYRNKNHEGYVMVSPNSIVTVPYTVINNGGGIDTIIVGITTSKYPYSIYTGDNFVARIEADSSYSGTPDDFKDLSVGTLMELNLIFEIPDTQLYDTNIYTVSVSSASDESVLATLETFMIDP